MDRLQWLSFCRPQPAGTRATALWWFDEIYQPCSFKPITLLNVSRDDQTTPAASCTFCAIDSSCTSKVCVYALFSFLVILRAILLRGGACWFQSSVVTTLSPQSLLKELDQDRSWFWGVAHSSVNFWGGNWCFFFYRKQYKYIRGNLYNFLFHFIFLLLCTSPLFEDLISIPSRFFFGCVSEHEQTICWEFKSFGHRRGLEAVLRGEQPSSARPGPAKIRLCFCGFPRPELGHKGYRESFW